MDFIRDLHESRMTRGENNVKQLTYTDCLERAYLTLLALEAMRQYPEYQDRVARYARSTVVYASFEHYRISGTDLYNFLYFINGSDKDLDKLADPEAAKRLRKQMTVPLSDIKRYLESLKNKTAPQGVYAAFQKIERNLRIRNTQYQQLRRGITTLKDLSPDDRKAVVTRLLFASRAKLRNHDFVDDIEKWAADENLEKRIAVDPEPQVSTPDITVSNRDLALYRYLTGTKNLALLKRFLEQAQSGNAVSAEMLRAYLPVIEMVNDIVAGGPAYIQTMRALRERAKRSPKR